MSTKVAVIRRNGTLVPVEVFLSQCLYPFSQQRNLLGKIKRVTGICKLRKTLRISQSKLSLLLEPFVGKRYSNSTISHWEMAERKKVLPRRYWLDHYLRDKTLIAIAALIARIVEWISEGKLTATVKGKRKWVVNVVAAR